MPKSYYDVASFLDEFPSAMRFLEREHHVSFRGYTRKDGTPAIAIVYPSPAAQRGFENLMTDTNHETHELCKGFFAKLLQFPFDFLHQDKVPKAWRPSPE